jgi:hypothetical protein
MFVHTLSYLTAVHCFQKFRGGVLIFCNLNRAGFGTEGFVVLFRSSSKTSKEI